MIPRTYPSTYAANGQQQMVGYYLGSVTGLTKWVDYIPVRLAQTAPGSENTYNQDGYIPVASLSSVAGLTPFKDYVPLYIDNTATDVWTTNIAGYIPTGISGFGGASLGLDFTTSTTLDPLITFSRASNATYFNKFGVMKTASANGPRFDYDPVTLAPKGLLIEEQRTNLLTYSQEFDNAAWTKTRSSITANTVVAPDGTLTGDKLVEDTATGVHATYPASYSATNTTLTSSIYAKAGEKSNVLLEISNFSTGSALCRFNLANVTIGTPSSTTSDYTNVSATITPVGNGWYRCTLTATKGTTNNTNRFVINLDTGTTNSYTGDGTSGIYIWGAQLEVGAFPTSYIPTTSAQVTRSADAASMTGANFSSWYNQSEGTLFVDATPAANGLNAFAVINDGTNNEAFNTYWATGSISFQVRDGAATQASLAIAGTLPFKVAGAYKVNDFASSVNGSTALTDITGSLPSVNQMSLGSLASGNYLNGHIRKIAYYPRRLSNTELQAITS